MKHQTKQYGASASKANASPTFELPEELKLRVSRAVSDIGDYLRAWEAAEYLGISESTLAKLRMRHNRSKGPNFIKSGGIIIYRRDDLDEWLESKIVEGDA